MAATGIINAQDRLVLEEIRAICEELDPQAAEQLNRFMPGRIMPNPDKRPAEYRLFLSEAVLILARAVRGKKRGRPKNVVLHVDKESQAS